MTHMVADPGEDPMTDREWMRNELQGVMTVFQQQELRFTDLAQAQDARISEMVEAHQAEAQARSDLYTATRGIADSVVTAKSEVDHMNAAVAESIMNKGEENRQIVQEMRRT